MNYWYPWTTVVVQLRIPTVRPVTNGITGVTLSSRSIKPRVLIHPTKTKKYDSIRERLHSNT